MNHIKQEDVKPTLVKEEPKDANLSITSKVITNGKEEMKKEEMDVVVKPTTHESDGRKSLWQGSSQYRHWMFSQEMLLKQRTHTNETGVSAIKRAYEAEEVCSSPPSPALHRSSPLCALFGNLLTLDVEYRPAHQMESNLSMHRKSLRLSSSTLTKSPRFVITFGGQKKSRRRQ